MGCTPYKESINGTPCTDMMGTNIVFRISPLPDPPCKWVGGRPIEVPTMEIRGFTDDLDNILWHWQGPRYRD